MTKAQTHTTKSPMGPTLAMSSCGRIVKKESIVDKDPTCAKCQRISK